MKKLLLLFVLFSGLTFSQMPNISNVWLNNSKAYTGTIGTKDQEMKLKIEISEQNRKNDQEYFVSGYTLVGTTYSKFEGKLVITRYKDSGKKGTVYGTYDLAEENKGLHSGTLKGKWVYIFRWNRETEKIGSQEILLDGNWRSYDGTMDFKTRLRNR